MISSVEEVAIKLKTSKQSIYNKLKLKEYKSKILTKQGKTYIDDDLFKMIQDSLKVKVNLNIDNTKNTKETINETSKDDEDTEDIRISTDILNLNNELIYTLKDQLKEKDIQIHEKDNQIHELHKLIENSQVLLKYKPQQDIKLLEEHFKDLDNSLIEVRERMEERKNKNSSKTNIFQRIFKK